MTVVKPLHLGQINKKINIIFRVNWLTIFIEDDNSNLDLFAINQLSLLHI